MKSILFDGKWLYKGPVSGKKVLGKQLRGLLGSKKFNITVVIQRNDLSKFIDEFPEVEYICLNSRINHALINMILFPLITYKRKFDLTFTHNFAPIWSRSKSFCFIHDVLYLDFPHFFSFKERLYFKLISLSAILSNKVISISKSEVERIEKSFNRSDVVLCYNGVDVPENSKNIISNNKSRSYIFYLGRLNVRKNIENLIRAVEFLPNDISLVIGGERDNLSSDLANLVQSLDLANRIEFTGFINEFLLVDYFKNAEVFCFPSLAEGFGLPPLEAMSYGTPVVVSNATCLPEICGEAAIYFDPSNPIDIASAISKVLNDEEVKNRMVDMGYLRVGHFKWENSLNTLIDILNE